MPTAILTLIGKGLDIYSTLVAQDNSPEGIARAQAAALAAMETHFADNETAITTALTSGNQAALQAAEQEQRKELSQ